MTHLAHVCVEYSQQKSLKIQTNMEFHKDGAIYTVKEHLQYRQVLLTLSLFLYSVDRSIFMLRWNSVLVHLCKDFCCD